MSEFASNEYKSFIDAGGANTFQWKSSRAYGIRSEFMSKFHLMHCVPPGFQGPKGYLEDIESVRWALEQLKHDVIYSLNRFHSARTNIVLGAHMLPLDLWPALGNETPKLGPVRYAPVLSRSPKPQVQDIDVSIYGSAGEKRVSAFEQLSHEGYQVLFASSARRQTISLLGRKSCWVSTSSIAARYLKRCVYLICSPTGKPWRLQT